MQELEYLKVTVACETQIGMANTLLGGQIVGDVGKLSNIVWIRSSTRDVACAAAIAGSEGKDLYQLCAADVDHYISVRAINEEVAMHAAFVGPILAGPARLLQLGIIGACHVGNVIAAAPTYIGGTEGCSEFWWLRINKGKRENVFEPRPIEPKDGCYRAVMSRLDALHAADAAWLRKSGFDINADTMDPRVYMLTESDIGCELKVKCRPVRSDGVRGEVFTSKATPKVSAVRSESNDRVLLPETAAGGMLL